MWQQEAPTKRMEIDTVANSVQQLMEQMVNSNGEGSRTTQHHCCCCCPHSTDQMFRLRNGAHG